MAPRTAQQTVEYIKAWIISTFAKYDNYIRLGPRGMAKMDVVDCADELRRITHTMQSHMRAVTRDRTTRPADLDQLRRNFAAIIMDLLRHIVCRAGNAYAHISWPRPTYASEPAIDRDLYLRLIGTPPYSGYFGLDVLEAVGVHTLQSALVVSAVRTVLQTLMHKRAPSGYIAYYQQITGCGR